MSKHLFLIGLLSITLSSCDKDPVPNPDGTFPTSIELSGTQTTSLTLTNHIVDPNVPDYCVSGPYFIEADIVVEPGVTIQMKNGSKIRVRTNGSFKSIGTANEKITIEGEAAFTTGQWGNIHFSSNNFDNQLIHTNVSGGGADVTPYEAMIFIGFQGSLLMDNCNFHFSSSNGVMAENTNSTLVGISNCDISGCGMYPINVDSRQVAAIDPSITGSGNANNLIEVRPSQMQNSTIWHNISFPYHMNGTLSIIEDIEIKPGTTFSFAPGARIQVEGGGSLNCIGTAADNIRFRGDTFTPGSWDGIVITSSDNPLNEFQHCQFSYGGGDLTYTGIITLWSDSYARIGNSSITNSAACGVYVLSTSTYNDDGNNVLSGNVTDICP